MHIGNTFKILIVLNLGCNGFALPEKYWQGNWFPTDPNTDDLNEIVDPKQIENNDTKEPSPSELHDDKHGIKMGVSSSRCDNAKTNLTIDWDGSSEDYTCFSNELYKPDFNINPVEHCDNIPKNYWALHECMNKTIEYEDVIPTYGTHRPLWAQYGEYKFLPKQRWLHNLEHGAIVMLYHPCTHPKVVNKLKKILKTCLFRHVITPFKELTAKRPIALLSWGCRLTMSEVDLEVVKAFIKMRALKGPEAISREGQFKAELIDPAVVVSTKDDKEICPE